MKGKFTKYFFIFISLSSLCLANENIKRSIKEKSLATKQLDVVKIDKNTLLNLQNKAIESIGNSLNLDTSIFNRKNKFSLYLKVSRNSKFGFRYKF